MLYTSPCDDPLHADYLNRQYKMADFASDARNAISTVCAPYFGTEFGKLLAYALKDGQQEAVDICDALGIGEKEMACLIDDDNWFDEVIYDIYKSR